MTNLITVKVTTLVSLLVASLIASFLPFVINKISVWYERRRRAKLGLNIKAAKPNLMILKILDLSQGFAGGVLLAGGLLHLIPESSEIIHDCIASLSGDEKAWYVNFPWALLCSCLSLFGLYSVETLANMIVGGSHHRHQHHSHEHNAPSQYQQSQQQKHIRSSSLNNYYGEESSLLPKEELVEDGNATHSVLGKIISAVVLWFSLGLHSVFAGMGLGSEDDEKVCNFF